MKNLKVRKNQMNCEIEGHQVNLSIQSKGSVEENISAVTYVPQESALYVGTAVCCNGRLMKYAVNNGQLELQSEVEPDFNVYDILPTTPILIAGAGCAGDGVRSVDMETGTLETIVKSSDYDEGTHCQIRVFGKEGQVSILNRYRQEYRRDEVDYEALGISKDNLESALNSETRNNCCDLNRSW